MPAPQPTRSVAEPEILRPRVRGSDTLFSDNNLDMLSHLLDDFLRIPGTNIRFGLDGIIGLIPGIGDVLGAMASWIIILAAWLRGVPKVTLARMLANVAIETIIGSVADPGRRVRHCLESESPQLRLAAASHGRCRIRGIPQQRCSRTGTGQFRRVWRTGAAGNDSAAA